MTASKSLQQEWKEIDQLVSEQKFEAAAQKLQALRKTLGPDRDEDDYTRALVREVQLRSALGGEETAVQLLRSEPWPQKPLWRAVLELFYARQLMNYYATYSWEVNQRERVEAAGELELKRWTRDQLFAEAGRAYGRVWALRESLGLEPVGRLKEYLDPNDYPPEIRGTLRDAVTYLWVEQLANTSGWTPQQSNELWALDEAALVHGDPEGSKSLKVADPSIHPLQRLGALLDDLEAWHLRHDRPEAALEARLERLRRLHESFTNAEDRALIRADLERRLQGKERLAWWSMGQSQLAEFFQASGLPEAKVLAHRAALAGEKAHPRSIGGKRCAHLARSIEAPGYQLQAMASDAPGKRSIAVAHRNLPALHFRAWRIDLVAHIRQAKDYNLLPGSREIAALLGRPHDFAWKADLPQTPDFEDHRTYVTPPMAARGAYVVVASAREDFREAANTLQGLPFLVTDLVLVTRGEAGGPEVTALSGSTGRPVPGAVVDLYEHDWQQGHHVIATATTDAAGRARLASRAGHSVFLVARKGADLTVDQSSFYVPSERRARAATSALVYTDRSVYRPLQKLYWKVIAYRGDAEAAKYRTLPQEKLTVTLRDANNQEVARASALTNGFGSASGEFSLPAGRLLGSWRIHTSLGGQASVQVEEYKRPTFEVSLKDPDSPLRLNREVRFAGEARYYFGLPVPAGQVKWRVVRTPVYPLWWSWWWREPPHEQGQPIASGAARLGEDGRFSLSFVPKADERAAGGPDSGAPGISFRYDLEADVTDEGGETRSASRSYRVGTVSVEAVIRAETGFLPSERRAELTVARTDLNGVARPGTGRWKLFALQQPSEALLPADQPLLPPPGAKPSFQTPGDRLRPRSEPGYVPEAVLASWGDGKELASGELQHDAEGVGRLALPALPPGAYRLRYATTDDFGAQAKASRDLVVGGAALPLELPLVLLAERTTVRAGETARFVAHSGLPAQAMVFEVYRAGKRVAEKQISTGQGPSVVEIPVGAADRGGFAVRLTAVRDHQLMSLQQSIYVPWDDKELQVELSTFRDRIRPGSRETWRVTVKGAKGTRPDEGAAELLAYMYDRSLDLFAPHQPANPLSLYPQRASLGGLDSSLGAAHPSFHGGQGLVKLPDYPYLKADRLRFEESYGIGGLGVRRGGARVSKSKKMDLGAMQPAPMAAAPMEDRAERKELAADAQEEPAAAKPSEGPPAAEVRSNFAETAFWQPHLLTGKDGSAAIEFTVPDSVTSWKLWVHAFTRDLHAGSLSKEAASVKELMVRPYLPRFLRSGDRAELKVVVNNASDRALEGQVRLEILDPETNADLLARFGLTGPAARPFSAAKGGSATLTYALAAPAQQGAVAFKVTAVSGPVSDGELRPLPVLPSRVQLAQSRFATLKGDATRTLRFDDLAKSDDPSRIDEALIVTVDGQLFYSALSALPYLINYPYECTEQTLNRFVSTGILTSLYDGYPSVAKMAAQLAGRTTPLETFDAADPNRKILLEESPWLLEAKGGTDAGAGTVNVLDPRAAAAEREAALLKLRKAQTANGAFPWWPGGPPSPYMTLYLMHGFAKAAEFGVPVPKEMVQRGWQYLAGHFRAEWQSWREKGVAWEFLTFLNYVASSYPDASWVADALTLQERRQILDFSLKHWKQHSPYLKAYLALTLQRMDRPKDARLVFDSVMDSAKTTEDEGTFWAPEDRSWLWYNDRVETHAFALRTLSELAPKDPRREGLVQWILLNKKLNHWKSTRATAEVLYSLAHYLKAEGQLAVREEATVTVGPRQQRFVFEPDAYTGKKNQIVVRDEQIVPAMAAIEVEKKTPGMLFASATWHFSTEKLPEAESGDLFAVSRRYYRRDRSDGEARLLPLAEGAVLRPGDEVEVHLSLRARHPAEYVHLRDPRGAGFEPVSVRSGYKWTTGLGYYEEIRDSGTNFFFEWLPQGEFTFTYRLRAATAGRFRAGPATVQSMYAPEFAAYSSGAMLEIKGE